MIPPTAYSAQGAGTLARTATFAGTLGDASSAKYSLGMKYTSKGTNPQGQVQLVLERPDGTYYVKSNAISSVALSGATPGKPAKDVTIYTKASIFKIAPDGTQTSIDGGATLRVDAHEGCTTSPGCASPGGDTIAFTVLSSKDSSLFFSSNWVYDTATLSWRTLPRSTGDAPSGVVIN